jgi:hypothetical protein
MKAIKNNAPLPAQGCCLLHIDKERFDPSAPLRFSTYSNFNAGPTISIP